MEPLHPSMFVPPEVPDWLPGSYQRAPTSEPADGRYCKVRNWMGRLLRIPDDEAHFAAARVNEANIISNKLQCIVDPVTNLTWLYSSAGERVCYLAGRYKMESVEQMQARNC